MPFPEQTFTSITQLITYINQFIIPNGQADITGAEHNNVENGLANFIVSYTLNSGLITIVTTGGAVTLPAPITAFASIAPTSVKWNDNVQNEYYIINTLGSVIPLAGGFTYVDLFGIPQTSIPVHTALHIAKASNGSWLQVNNLAGTGSFQADAQTILGRYANTAGPIQEITIGSGLTLNSTTGVLSSTALSSQSAYNGLSVDNTGKVVLGQSVGDSPQEAMLLSIREIPLNGFALHFTSPDGALTNLTKNQFKIQDSTGQFFFFADVTNAALTVSDNLGNAKFERAVGVGNFLIVNTLTGANGSLGTIQLVPQTLVVNPRTGFIFSDNASIITGSTAIFQIQNQSTVAHTTETANIVEILSTFNTSGAPIGIALKVTNTASSAASKLIDLQVAGVSKFSVYTNSGNVVAGGADDGSFFQIHQPSVAASTNGLNITSTWNTSGTPTLIRGSVTNTASAGGKLIELIASGVTQLSIDATGSPILIGPTIADFSHDVQIAGSILVDGGNIDLNGFGSITVAGGTITSPSILLGQLTNNVSPFQINSVFNGANVAVDVIVTWIGASQIQSGYKLRVTDTSSNAASLLMDLQVGGASKFTIRKDGLLTLAAAQLSSATLNTVDHKIIINIAGTSYYLLASTSPT